MTSDDALPDPPTRRDRLVARRRSRAARVVLVGLVVVAVAGAAFAAVALAGDDPAPAAAPTTTSARASRSPDIDRLNALAEQEPKRPLTHDEPLRLWLGGDSLAGALGMAMGDLTSDTGIVDLYVDYKVSSGIGSDDVRDWPERAADAMAAQDPEAVVFMIGTNDTVLVDRDGEWEAPYRQRVGDLMDLFVGDTERTVFWIGAPTLGDSDMDDAAIDVNRVMREEANERDDVVYVDAYALFSGPDGEYTQSLVTSDGEERRVRVGDGVHFTAAGGQHLASEVFDLLDARWRIRAQADPDNPIGFDIAEGGEHDWTTDTQERNYEWSDDDHDGDAITPTTDTSVAPTSVAPTSPTTVVVPSTLPPTTIVTPSTGPPPTTGVGAGTGGGATP
ncbi:MAG TPA: DUF459 domain-containing protein [Acidimicrobiia bacterium]|nr:DUF459 domain-containing protein [Acidimicrobiia bacterium]